MSTTPFCPSGSTYDPVVRGCVPDRYRNPSNPTPGGVLGGAPETQTGTGTVPNCGPSAEWDNARRMCVPKSPTPTPAPTPPTTAAGAPCPPGYHRGGGHPSNPCRPDKAAPAPGGGGAAAPRPAVAPGPAPGEDIEAMIRNYLTQALGGQNDPYSPASITAMRNQAFRETMGGAARERQQLQEDLISRGMERAGERTRGFADIERGASAQYGARSGQITIETTRANAENRLRVLGMMQQWLDQKRNYLLQKESNAITREIGLAQIKLGYAKIDAEKEMLQMQLSRMGGGGGGGDQDEEDLRTILQILFPAGR